MLFYEGFSCPPGDRPHDNLMLIKNSPAKYAQNVYAKDLLGFMKLYSCKMSPQFSFHWEQQADQLSFQVFLDLPSFGSMSRRIHVRVVVSLRKQVSQKRM